MINADHHFHIGLTHINNGKPCQDYSISGNINLFGDVGGAYAIVSDGCSSGGETDVGSRIVALSTLEALKQTPRECANNPFDVKFYKDVYRINDITQLHMFQSQRILGLKQTDLYATLLYAYVDSNGNGYTCILGDGAIAVKYKDGYLGIMKYEWDSNTPFYPGYLIHKDFIAAHGGIENKALTQTGYSITAEGIENTYEIKHTVGDGIKGFITPICKNNASGISQVALFTDGVFQIDGVDWLDAIKALMGFKNTSGQFVKRRLIKYLKDIGKDGHYPMDDIGYAVINIGEDLV